MALLLSGGSSQRFEWGFAFMGNDEPRFSSLALAALSLSTWVQALGCKALNRGCHGLALSCSETWLVLEKKFSVLLKSNKSRENTI